MLSVITAVYNQLPMNQLFVKTLAQYTDVPYELIIIDNCSDDGTREFFKGIGSHVKVIENDQNYPYSYCQNQGIRAAKYDTYAFLNNDIIVSPKWGSRILSVMEKNDLEIVTPCGIERMESKLMTRYFRKKWMYIKYLISFFGITQNNLALMHRLMYGNWEKFCERRFSKYGHSLLNGMLGHSVIMKKSAIDKVGMWDELVWAADWDIYARTTRRSMEKNDIKPIHTALGVFHHHYIRLTCTNSKQIPVSTHKKLNSMSMQEKWGIEGIAKYTRGMN